MILPGNENDVVLVDDKVYESHKHPTIVFLVFLELLGGIVAVVKSDELVYEYAVLLLGFGSFA